MPHHDPRIVLDIRGIRADDAAPQRAGVARIDVFQGAEVGDGYLAAHAFHGWVGGVRNGCAPCETGGIYRGL